MFDNILKLGKSKYTSVVCLDLSAYFDTVNQKILLDVLKNHFAVTEQALS